MTDSGGHNGSLSSWNQARFTVASSFYQSLGPFKPAYPWRTTHGVHRAFSTLYIFADTLIPKAMVPGWEWVSDIPVVAMRTPSLSSRLHRRRCMGKSERKSAEQQYSFFATTPELLRVFTKAMGCASHLVAPRPGRAREDP